MKRSSIIFLCFALLLSSLYSSAASKTDSAKMNMVYDLSNLRRPSYEVGFTDYEISASGAIDRTASIDFVADLSTLKFKPYSGLYLSYYFKENDKVGIYLELNGNLVSSDSSDELIYKVSFKDSELGEIYSNSDDAFKVRDVSATSRVGDINYGSIAFDIEVVDSFSKIYSNNLSSSMTIRVMSEV